MARLNSICFLYYDRIILGRGTITWYLFSAAVDTVSWICKGKITSDLFEGKISLWRV